MPPLSAKEHLCLMPAAVHLLIGLAAAFPTTPALN